MGYKISKGASDLQVIILKWCFFGGGFHGFWEPDRLKIST